MKAITVIGPNNAEYQNVETPIPKDNMILIKVIRAGICATDLAIYSGECSFVKDGSIKYPVRIGHEYSGIVEAVGENVRNFKNGDRVYTDNAVSCNKCEACIDKRYEQCPNIRSVGTVNTWDGCFAEYMYMPEHHVYHLPDSISFDEAALIEPASIAFDAFHNVKITKDDTVAVIGTGSIGMSAAWLSKHYGAGKVIMVGRNDNKLEIAKQIGADETINSTKVNPVEALKNLTYGRGVNMIIETSGSSDALINSIYSTINEGLIVTLSFYEKNLDNMPIDHLVINRITLRGGAGRFGNPNAVCEIMAKNPVKITPIITHKIKFDECLRVFENEKAYHKDKIKIMVEFN